jgi:hypothetical protein
MKRRRFIALATIFAIAGVPASAATGPRIDVYKSPACGCCSKWAEHLQLNGFEVTTHEVNDLTAFRTKAGVPQRLASCHTALIEGYAVEGHVPAADIQRLIRERPKARGLSVPGMPRGSPGMEGPRADPYDVLLFSADGATRIYRSYSGA